jgi:2-keto-4-pentenoate hydratase
MDQGKVRAMGRALAAARGGGRISLAEGMAADDRDEAFAIQAETFAVLNAPIGGFKVGAPAPDSQDITCAPLTANTVIFGGDSITVTERRPLWVEAEIAFKLGADLPAREKPYTQEDAYQAVGTLHAAIEVVDSRFSEWPDIPPMAQLSDLSANGRLVLSEGHYAPRHFVPGDITVDFSMGRIRKTMGPETFAGGDPMRLVTWLANNTSLWGKRGSDRGLIAGDVITTGSWIGVVPAEPDTEATVTIEGVGSVTVQIHGA